MQFDATLKRLVQDFPLDWANALDMAPTGPVEVLTPDLSTVSAFADTVLSLGDRLLHIDFQSGPDPILPRRLLLYNVLLYDRYELPVHTVVVLLRPRADRGDLTNRVTYAAHPGRGGMDFEFEIMRLWQIPVTSLLSAGVGLLPLAPLGQLPEGIPMQQALQGAVDTIIRRAEGEAVPPLGREVEAAAYILAGLRLPEEVVEELFKGARHMRESTTYQHILNEGRSEERAKAQAEIIKALRRTVFRLGRIRWGEPDAVATAALEAISDQKRLERLTERLLLVTTWDELLAAL
jgi:predicted transposase YdaD